MAKRKQTEPQIDPQKAAEVLAQEQRQRVEACAQEFRRVKEEIEQKHRCAVMPVLIVRATGITVDWEVIPVG